jgi:cyclohexanone monooxygenase
MTSNNGTPAEYDVVIVGAGFGGLYALHHLRGLGLRCHVYEAGSGVGGTWYWNRYPGARCDIESVEYSYSFSPELQDEWDWTERYAAQPEILRYLNHVADRFDLRRDISFDTVVEAAVFDEADDRWVITTADSTVRARYCVMAVGFLSAKHLPDIPGLTDFAGALHHTGAWPQDGLDVSGKRVGVIGTGASGVQAIPLLAAEAAQLVVFQRSATYCVPLQNGPITPEYRRFVKENYAEIRERERFIEIGGFTLRDQKIAEPSTALALDASPEGRLAEFEYRWRVGGLHFYHSYVDLAYDDRANQTARDFFEMKIRSIVKDSAVADALVPRDHPIMAKRLCGENGYYEAFNRPNVTLVNIREAPISRVTADGVQLENGEHYPLDILVCATGYDSGTGPLVRLDIRGRGGRTLRDHWAGGCRTHLGIMSNGFPNMFILDGPQSPSAFYSPPLLVQYQVDWISSVIGQLAAAGAATAEPTVEDEAGWGEHVQELAAQTLLVKANSPYMGANIPGKPRECLYYLGGISEYLRRCRGASELGAARDAAELEAATT